MSANHSLSDTGFVYVATGERYFQEAAASAQSLRWSNPGRRVCLITDKILGPSFWDDLVVLDEPSFGFRDKLTMVRCPYSRFVFLDTDTHVAGDLSELFKLLERFDACGVQLFEGHDYRIEGVPDAYAEINGGVLGFRRGLATDAFFLLWTQYYQAFHSQNRDGYYHYANVGDQKSLRAALWHSNLRFAAIGPEFNFIPFKVDFAAMPVKVLHTRTNQGLTTLFARLNARLGRRAYLPQLDVVVSGDMPDAELWRLFVSAFFQLLRRAGRALIPLRLRNYLRQQPGIRRRFFGNPYSSSLEGHVEKWEQ